MATDKTSLGDRMKDYESRTTADKFLPMLPVYARLDGRSFHSFCRGMKRPLDQDFRDAMFEVTKYLVEESHATIGYTQSDEISLVFYTDDYKSQIFFDGVVFKMISSLAALATAKMVQIALQKWPKKALPTFDCRVCQLPNKKETINMLIWRIRDSMRNSLSMLAQSVYSHKELHQKGQKDLHDMLHDKGVNWNNYPSEFKEGLFVKRLSFVKILTNEELLKIPIKHRPENAKAIRSEVTKLILPHFESILNKEEIVFGKDISEAKVQATESIIYGYNLVTGERTLTEGPMDILIGGNYENRS